METILPQRRRAHDVLAAKNANSANVKLLKIQKKNKMYSKQPKFFAQFALFAAKSISVHQYIPGLRFASSGLEIKRGG